MTRPAPESRERDRSFSLGALLVFACLVAILTNAHEPWHDELQAWRLAIDSTSLADLVRNLRYEGHPIFPYLLFRALGVASRFWTYAIIAHAVIACGCAWIVLRYAPFDRLHRLLIIFGYYFVFEYAVIVRPYGLGMLLALAACALWCATQRREKTAVVLLILAANTSAVGLALALALGFGFTVDATEEWGERWWTQRSRRRAVGVAFAIALLVAVTVALQILPPADAMYRGGSLEPSQSGLWLVGRSLSTPARALLPFAGTLADGSTQWNTWALSPSSRTQVVLTDLLALALFLVGALVVSRRRSALSLWAAGCGGFMVYFTLFHPGAARHHGYIVVTFIAAAWLAYARPRTRWAPSVARMLDRLEPFRMPALTLLLLPMVGAAVQLGRADRVEQFASDSEIVALLRRDHLDELPIVGVSYPWSQSVAALLDRPVYLTAEGRAGTWVNAGRVRYDHPTSALLDATVRELSTTHCQVVVLTDRDPLFSPWLQPQLRHLAPRGVTPMSGRAVDVWLATAPRCAATGR